MILGEKNTRSVKLDFTERVLIVRKVGAMGKRQLSGKLLSKTDKWHVDRDRIGRCWLFSLFIGLREIAQYPSSFQMIFTKSGRLVIDNQGFER